MSSFERNLLRVGFHSVYESSIEKAVDYALEYGFSSVQIETAMPTFFPEKYNMKKREKIRDYAKERNITLKVHAPGEDFSLQTLHMTIQKAVIERFREIIDFARDLSAKLCTIHPGTLPVFTIPGKGNVPIDVQYRELHIKGLKAALFNLVDYSHGKTLLCVENSPFTENVMKVLEEIIFDKEVFLTWDLAKMYGNDGLVDQRIESFFLDHLDKVRECHLHDRTRDHGHQIIGEGFVDFKHYMNLLSGYDVEYTIEVRPVENAVRSLKALRFLIT